MINILLLGNRQVGKTCLASQICNAPLPLTCTPTLEIQHYHRVVNSDPEITLEVWDPPSNEFINSTLKPYYEKADVFILMFSLINNHSFQAIEDWMKMIKQNSQPSARVILVGNKSDLPKRMVNKEKIKSWRSKNDIPYYEISCEKNKGYQAVLKEVVENVKVNLDEPVREGKSRCGSIGSFADHGTLDTASSSLDTLFGSARKGECAGCDQWRNELRKVEERFENELRLMREEFLSMNERGNENSKDRMNGTYPETEENYEKILKGIRKLEVVSEALEEDVANLIKKVENNDDRINKISLFVENELKRVENHLIDEIDKKLQSNSEQMSETNPELEEVVEELNDMIRSCIAETDDFYNGLRTQLDWKNHVELEIEDDSQTNNVLLEIDPGSLQLCDRVLSLRSKVANLSSAQRLKMQKKSRSEGFNCTTRIIGGRKPFDLNFAPSKIVPQIVKSPVEDLPFSGLFDGKQDLNIEETK